MRRRLWLVTVVVAVVALAATITVLVRRHRDITTLVAAGDTYTFCWEPPKPDDWSAMARTGMEFGLDLIGLAPSRGRVTVTEAVLNDPTGGIRLIKAVFAPSANFATGNLGEHWGVETYAAPYLRTLPAVIEPAATPIEAPPIYNGSQWQLGVLVTAPVNSKEAAASGLTLHYESEGHRRTFRTNDRIRLVNDPAAHCGFS